VDPQPITDGQLIDDQAGPACILFQLLPQAAHCDAEIIDPILLRGAPDCAKQLRMAHDPIRAAA